MITITDVAKSKIKEIAESESISDLSIRVKILSGGCAGFQQDMNFDTNQLEDDEVILVDDIKILIDPISHQYLDNSVIDWEGGLFAGGFVFRNPNVSGSCGCNKSVSF